MIKAKEFFIIEKENDPDQVTYENFPGSIRVIEYAYCAELLKQNEIMRAALEFYANKHGLIVSSATLRANVNIAKTALEKCGRH